MYSFVGKMLVLQPDSNVTFVKGEGYHPSLPAQPGLFLMRQPSVLGSAVAAAASEVAAVAGGEVNPVLPHVPESLTEAVQKLMDAPHPLETLGDTEAYGSDGSISRWVCCCRICQIFGGPRGYFRQVACVLMGMKKRLRYSIQLNLMPTVHASSPAPSIPVVTPPLLLRYHNPDNYTRALGGVLRSKPFWRLLQPATMSGAPRWYMAHHGPGVREEGERQATPTVLLAGASQRLPLFQLGKRQAAAGSDKAAAM